MPLAQLNELYTRLSGRSKNASNVNSYAGGQPIVRKFTTPTNPDTTEQQTARSIFSSVTKRWSDNLSAGQREDWDAWAKLHKVINRLGTEVKRTGLSAYVQLGTICQMRTGTAAPSDAPTLERPAAPTAVDVPSGQSGGNTLSITIDHGFTSTAGLYVMVKATDAMPTAGTNPRLPDYRMIEGPDSSSFKALTTSGASYDFTATRYSYSDADRLGVWVAVVNSEGYMSEPFYAVFNYSV